VRFEVLMGMNIIITVFQDAIPCSLVLRKPATSTFRVKAVWKQMVHDKEGRTKNQDSTSANTR
jgi:hypothetical protein